MINVTPVAQVELHVTCLFAAALSRVELCVVHTARPHLLEGSSWPSAPPPEKLRPSSDALRKLRWFDRGRNSPGTQLGDSIGGVASVISKR